MVYIIASTVHIATAARAPCIVLGVVMTYSGVLARLLVASEASLLVGGRA